MDAQDLQKLKVQELKKELKARGLPVAGSKAELVARLQEALQENGEEQEDTVADEVEVDPTADEGEDIAGEDLTDDVLNESEEVEEGDTLPEEAADPVPTSPTEEKKAISVKITGPDSSGTAKSQSGSRSAAERLQERARRFGVQSEDARKQARAARFGLVTSQPTSKATSAISSAGSTADVEKLKKRAERFGTVVSSALTKVDEQERIRKRKERFGAAISSSSPSVISTSDVEEKKRKRAERFGLVQ